MPLFTKYVLEHCCPYTSMRDSYSGTGLLFNNDTACKLFYKFRKYGTIDDEEAKILSLVRFDAIILDTIQSFGAMFEEAKAWIGFETSTFKDLTRNKTRKFWSRKESLTSHKSARRLTEILLATARNILKHDLFEFWRYLENLKISGDVIDLKLLVLSAGSNEQRLNNMGKSTLFAYSIQESDTTIFL